MFLDSSSKTASIPAIETDLIRQNNYCHFLKYGKQLFKMV